MTSLQNQLDLSEASKVATDALEASSRLSISELFDLWDAGEFTGASVRHKLENVVRAAYRSSASVARVEAQLSSELTEWSPVEVFNTDYLQALLSDVRRNLRDYKSGALSREQSISRIEHSAGVASKRGYTDQMLLSYKELEDFGFRASKFWLANFVDNTPCHLCVSLHGTERPLDQPFPSTGTGVYQDLYGPPRHPRCRCRLFVFIRTMENAFEKPDFTAPQAPTYSLSSDDVKKFSGGIFASIKASLSAMLRVFRRRRAK